MLIDRFGRSITNLRISITERCNLKCIYCHKEGYESKKIDELSPNEIKTICNAFKELGIRKLKITGGEPLIRDDLIDIISILPKFDEISLTTNGTLLSKFAFDLKRAGLNRVNVSLDTLNADKYKLITGYQKLKSVIDGIYAAYDAGLCPIKINMVVLKGINDDEVPELIEFTRQFNKNGINVILQVIELLDLFKPSLKQYYFDVSKIENSIKNNARKVIVRRMHKRKQYIFDDFAIEFVKPVNNPEFCLACNRIRVTADGKIKPCLLRENNLVDIRGLDGDKLKNAIRKAIYLREPFFKGKCYI